jgi:dihydrolipoamide dehydrogenase
MPQTTEVKVPDIGDFGDIEIIEVAVAPGDRVEVEQGLITLESDKATMEVPSPAAGVVKTMAVSVGDRVSEGSLILTLETAGEAAAAETATAPETAPDESRAVLAAPAPPAAATGDADVHAQVVVIGAGPGGYTAAFRAADLGQKTVLIERYPTLGGVCLNVGCIPSKALLHTAEVINAAAAMAEHGVDFGNPEITLAKLAAWKDAIVAQLTKGLAGLARQRKVEVLQGVAKFVSPHMLEVNGADESRDGRGRAKQAGIVPDNPLHSSHPWRSDARADGVVRVSFEQAIIAAGSQATQIASFPNDDPRLMDSTSALVLEEVPKRLLVIGGGIIGLEMATVYQALGSRVTVVELLDDLMPGCDRDLVRPLARRIGKLYQAIYLGTRVTAIDVQKKGLKVHFEGAKAPASEVFERVLVAVGRRPNGHRIGADAAGVAVDDAGFISVDSQQRTNVAHIFAIGDITGQPMLAHKATHQGKVAAEAVSGEKSHFDALAIPSVAYTDPEIAWTGVTESEAKEQGLDLDKATFPWAASGRSLGMGRNEGLTKLLFDKASGRLIGAGIVGPHAGDLISEANLALEMGADAADIALTIHPHPTLSETVNFAAEMVEGTITDLYLPRRK